MDSRKGQKFLRVFDVDPNKFQGEVHYRSNF